MPATNTATHYGTIARTLHWLTALIILTNIPLGLVANGMPFATGADLATKAQLFSLHKTLGLAAFAVALIRILWALTQPRPEPLHPNRPWETRLAELVHWTLYISLIAVPLSGWVTHAATDGFAPILWPFGDDLPFVPTSEAIASTAGAMHWLFTKILVTSILLHIAGALKHVFIDRDATLSRMTLGRDAPTPAKGTPHPRTPAIAALLIYVAGAGLAWSMAAIQSGTDAPTTQTATTGNWQVTTGTLTFAVKQMGSQLPGQFGLWAADIQFDEATSTGKVTVTIDTTSLTIGSVSDQAKGPQFFDAATHPTATFTADIAPNGPDYTAAGTLTLHGITAPLTLPFTLAIQGDTATMQGTTTLDRRAFKIGDAYPDESSVGFMADVTVALTATRQ
jgi:cytochrome b561/polyisoprenoid-binding protein YceI